MFYNSPTYIISTLVNGLYKNLLKEKENADELIGCRAVTIRFDASEIDYRPADAIFDS